MNESQEKLLCSIFGLNLASFWKFFIFIFVSPAPNLLAYFFGILQLACPLSLMIAFSMLGQRIKYCNRIAIVFLLVGLLQILFLFFVGAFDFVIIATAFLYICNIIVLISFKNIYLDLNPTNINKILKSFILFSIAWAFITILFGVYNSTTFFVWVLTSIIIGAYWGYWKKNQILG